MTNLDLSSLHSNDLLGWTNESAVNIGDEVALVYPLSCTDNTNAAWPVFDFVTWWTWTNPYTGGTEIKSNTSTAMMEPGSRKYRAKLTVSPQKSVIMIATRTNQPPAVPK